MQWIPTASGFASSVVRWRTLLMVSILAISGYLAFCLPHLVIDGSIERIMLKGDPEKAFHEQSVQLFGGDDMISVVLPCPTGVWHAEELQEIQRITEKVAGIEGVEDVYSLTNYPLVNSDLGVLTTATVIERMEQGATFDELRELAHGDVAVINNMVSQDGRDASINLRLKSGRGAPIGFHNQLVKQVRETLDQACGDRTYYVAGWPVIKADLTQFMERDLVVLLPIVALVVTLLLVVSFRRFTGVLLPFLAIALSLIWTIGGMIVTDHAMTIVSNSLPVIIIAVGATYCIYVATHIFRAIDEGRERHDAIRHALHETAPGVLLSGFTTVIGFASLKFNQLDVIDEFGTVSIWGSIASMVMALVFMPCLALYLPIKKRPLQTEQLSARWGRWLDLVLTHRRWVWGATGLVVIVSGLLLTRVRVETAPVSWFPKDSQVRRSVDYANGHLTGITPYNILIQTKEEGGIQDPAVLTKISQLQQWLVAQPEVDATLSIADTTHQVFQALGGEQTELPTDRAGVEQVLMLARSEDVAGLNALLSSDGRTANILIRSSILSSELGVQFAERVDQYLKQNFEGYALAKTTGNAYLTYRTNLQFTSGFVASLAFGIGVIGLLMVFVLRSVKLGALSLVANLIPIAVNYAMLGIGDLTLNAATSITGCIALGNAVDSTLHFLIGYRKRYAESGDQRLALRQTLEVEGWPIVTTSLALSVGFSVLMMSNFMPVVSLGLLVAFTMLMCMICNLALLPVLLTAKLPEGILLKMTWKPTAQEPVRDRSLQTSH